MLRPYCYLLLTGVVGMWWIGVGLVLVVEALS